MGQCLFIIYPSQANNHLQTSALQSQCGDHKKKDVCTRTTTANRSTGIGMNRRTEHMYTAQRSHEIHKGESR